MAILTNITALITWIFTAATTLISGASNATAATYAAVVANIRLRRTRFERYYKQRALHARTDVFWALLGTFTAYTAAFFIAPPLISDPLHPVDETHEMLIRFILHGVALFSLLVFFTAHLLSGSAFFRAQRDVDGDFVGTCFVTVVGLIVTWERQVSTSGLIAQLLIAVSVFALFRVLRARVDYGICNLFLRIPLQTSVLMYRDVKLRVDFSVFLAILALIECLVFSYLHLLFTRWTNEVVDDIAVDTDRLRRET